MEAISTDQDLDQFNWQCIEDSTNPLDFVDYLNFSYCTYAKQEEAYERLQQFWGSKNSYRCFEKVVATVINLAEGGNLLAMFHLGRWYRLGYGVEKNEALGIDWTMPGAAIFQPIHCLCCSLLGKQFIMLFSKLLSRSQE